MMKQLLIALAAAFISLPVSFLLIDKVYVALHPVDMSHGGGEVIQTGLVLGFFAAPVCAILAFAVTLYLVPRYGRDVEDE